MDKYKIVIKLMACAKYNKQNNDSTYMFR